MTCTWRQTQSGAWVVVGPPDEIAVGTTVEVVSKAGKARPVEIERIGEPFETPDGGWRVYGYPADDGSFTITDAQRQALSNCIDRKYEDPAMARPLIAASKELLRHPDAHKSEASDLLSQLLNLEVVRDTRPRWAKRNDEWVVSGLASEVRGGATVRVRTKAGEVSVVKIERVEPAEYGEYVFGFPLREERSENAEVV